MDDIRKLTFSPQPCPVLSYVKQWGFVSPKDTKEINLVYLSSKDSKCKISLSSLLFTFVYNKLVIIAGFT